MAASDGPNRRNAAGLLDAPMTLPMMTVAAVGQGIDVDFAGIVQETVEEHWRIVGNLDRLAAIALDEAFAHGSISTARPPSTQDGGRPAVADLAARRKVLFRCALCGWAAA